MRRGRARCLSRRAVFAASLAAAGCAGDEGVGSESHFIRCQDDLQCPIGVCVQTYCELNGQRITSDQLPGGAGGQAGNTPGSSGGVGGSPNPLVSSGGSGQGGTGASAGGVATGGTGSGGVTFLPCSPYPVCGSTSLPVIIFRPDLGTQDCLCETNPCGATELPSCSCAGALCTKYPGVQCVQYAPDSGFLQCSESG